MHYSCTKAIALILYRKGMTPNLFVNYKINWLQFKFFLVFQGLMAWEVCTKYNHILKSILFHLLTPKRYVIEILHVLFQFWLKQPLQHRIPFWAAVPGGPRRIPSHCGPHQQCSEKDPARQCKMAVLRLCLLLLYVRMLSLACHMPQ